MSGAATTPGEYLRDKIGREYVRAPGKGFPSYRRAGEEYADTLARAQAGPSTKRRNRKERGPDPAPRKPRKERAPNIPDASDSELEAMLAEMLAAPAIPMAAICLECSMHFAVQSGPTAKALVRAAAHNPGLRAALQRCYGVYVRSMWLLILQRYVAVPIAHHLVPANMRPLAMSVATFGGSNASADADPGPSMADMEAAMAAAMAMQQAHDHAHVDGTAEEVPDGAAAQAAA